MHLYVVWSRQANYKAKWLTSRLVATIGEKWENDNSQNNNTALNAKPRSMVPFFRSHPLLVRVYFTLHRTYDNPKHIESCAAGWQLLLLFTNLKGRAHSWYRLSSIWHTEYSWQPGTGGVHRWASPCPSWSNIFKPHRYCLGFIAPVHTRMPIRMASYLE